MKINTEHKPVIQEQKDLVKDDVKDGIIAIAKTVFLGASTYALFGPFCLPIKLLGLGYISKTIYDIATSTRVNQFLKIVFNPPVPIRAREAESHVVHHHVYRPAARDERLIPPPPPPPRRDPWYSWGLRRGSPLIREASSSVYHHRSDTAIPIVRRPAPSADRFSVGERGHRESPSSLASFIADIREPDMITVRRPAPEHDRFSVGERGSKATFLRSETPDISPTIARPFPSDDRVPVGHKGKRA